MTDKERTLLAACRVKGCPWRGGATQTCPLHPDQAWDSQHLLMPEHVVAKSQTRHRSRS